MRNPADDPDDAGSSQRIETEGNRCTPLEERQFQRQAAVNRTERRTNQGGNSIQGAEVGPDSDSGVVGNGPRRVAQTSCAAIRGPLEVGHSPSRGWFCMCARGWKTDPVA